MTLPYIASNPLRWLGGKIDIRVEVEVLAEGGGVWDVGEWDTAHWATFDWYDITKYVESIHISRGQPKWESRYAAGSCKLILDNTSGLFNPEVEPHLDAVPWRPGRRLRVLAFPDPSSPSTFYPLFTGRIDDSGDSFDFGTRDVVNTTRALDALADLHAFNPLALETATGVQSTDARVHAALDRLDWPEERRDIQEGEHTMQTSYLAQTTLEECQRAAEAEGGALFADTENKVVFRARDWLTTDTRSTEIQGYLGYATEQEEGVPHAPISAIKTSWDIYRIVNHATFARTGGSAYVAEDTDSKAVYGVRTYQRLDFQNNSDSEVEFLADRYIEARSGLPPRIRVDEVTIGANPDPDNEDLNRLFYDTQFGDLLAVKVDSEWGWSFECLGHVIGIEHNITPEDWEVTFTLDDALIPEEDE